MKIKNGRKLKKYLILFEPFDIYAIEEKLFIEKEPIIRYMWNGEMKPDMNHIVIQLKIIKIEKEEKKRPGYWWKKPVKQFLKNLWDRL